MDGVALHAFDFFYSVSVHLVHFLDISFTQIFDIVMAKAANKELFTLWTPEHAFALVMFAALTLILLLLFSFLFLVLFSVFFILKIFVVVSGVLNSRI